MATGKKRPTRGRRGPVVLWTTEEMQRLEHLVDTLPTKTEAFNVFAEETGRAKNTVVKKWYDSRRAGKKSALGGSDVSGVDVRGLSTDALVALHQEAKAEIDRRIAELSKAVE